VTENSLIKGPNRLDISLLDHENKLLLKCHASFKKSVNEQSPHLKKKREGGREGGKTVSQL
jgi:hypothetical protein